MACGFGYFNRASAFVIISIADDHRESFLCTCSYAAYLYFQLGTHREVAPAASGTGGSAVEGVDSDDGDEEEQTPSLSLTGAAFMLTSITVIVAFASE